MAEHIRLISRTDVIRTLEVDEEFLVELEREQVVAASEQGYAPDAVERIRVCYSLHHDLGVNVPGLAVALSLLDRLDDERRQFREVLDELRRRLDDDLVS